MKTTAPSRHPWQPQAAALLLGAFTVALAPVHGADSFNTSNSPNLPMRPLDSAGRHPTAPPSKEAANTPARFPLEFRSVTGAGTNPAHPEWGGADTAFLRLTPPAYTDGKDTPAGATRPSARLISNLVVAAPAQLISNAAGSSAMLWQWGQFIDHDLDLSAVASPEEAFDVVVPKGDPSFDPNATGLAVIALDRTLYVHDANGVRQQVNDITAFIDASQVYGSDAVRAKALRTLDGGRMKTSAGNLLPFNTDGLPNAPATSASFFIAGDFRVNEQVGLMAVQTLFLREHNHWADYFHQQDPKLTDEQIYQNARAIVGAEIQAITYREFLPILLGPGAIRPYAGYRPEVNPGVSNEFAAAAYRVGHTMLSPTLLRLNADGSAHADGELSLVASFFNVGELTKNGIEPLLSGLTVQAGQEVDNYLVAEVRNFLFGAPGSPGFDLASLNIQRGRDHGLPAYNAVRQSLGLKPAANFAAVGASTTAAANLAKAYASVDDIDLWVGGLAEAHVPGAMVGETFRAILRDQFERTRDGDRFWYQGYLPPEWVRCVEQQTLATIIRRNAVTDWKIAANAFLVPSATNAVATPDATLAKPAGKKPVKGSKAGKKGKKNQKA